MRRWVPRSLGLILVALVTALMPAPYGSAAPDHAGPSTASDVSPPVEIEPGFHYRSGTRVGSATVGLSFVIPDHWHGAMPVGSRTMFLESPTKPGIGLVVILEHVPMEALEAHLNEPQVIDEGYVLHPVGSATRTGDRIAARYHSGKNTGRALAVMGPSDTGIVYLFTGPKEEAEYYEAVLEGLAASTTHGHATDAADAREGQT